MLTANVQSPRPAARLARPSAALRAQRSALATAATLPPIAAMSAALAPTLPASAVTPVASVRLRQRLLPIIPLADAPATAPIAELLAAVGWSSLLLSGIDLARCQRLKANHPALQVGVMLTEAMAANLPTDAPLDYLCAASTNVVPLAATSAMTMPTLPALRSLKQLPRWLDRGVELVTLAPTDLASGTRLLKCLAQQAPTLRVLVLGAIARHELPIYLRHDNVSAVCAPWIFSPELLRRHQWSAIAEHLKLAQSLLSSRSADA